ncbi:MAG: 50S ribosomal protein L25 [Planctomycetota bacterium]
MHEDATPLHATKRERLGSRYAARSRKAGKLPAVVYGHKEDPVSVVIDAKEAIAHFVKGEKVFALDVDGGKVETVLLKDLQYDHLGMDIIHADFARVDLDERVITHPHIKLVGEAKGLKKSGAVLMHPLDSLEIECAVVNLPEEIEVDVTGLDAGESILAKDVTLPKPTMVLKTDPETVIATITHVSESEASTESVQTAEPEVAGEKKADE